MAEAKTQSSRPIAVAILRENEDGELEAVVLQSSHVPNNAGYFLFSQLKETRSPGAPTHFRLGSLSRSMQRTLNRWFG